MKVKNKGCLWRISLRQLKAAKMRTGISILAIALTTLLLTSLFTLSLSVNSSFQEYQFRLAGGYSHGSFKEVDGEQQKALAAHPKIKEYGMRTICGVILEPPFEKKHAEISWMDENCAKWSYISLQEGRLPQAKDEIAMDTLALEKLGIPAKIGSEVTLAYHLVDGDSFIRQEGREDRFTLVGFWEHDMLIPVHYINVSREYLEEAEKACIASGGEGFRSDMNVMLASSVRIRGVMEEIDRDLGYQWEDREADNCVRIGVNWGYSASELGSSMDVATVLIIVVILLLVVFTGYLIIYNIFRISVSQDVRFYGLLKTIGMTARQLKRIIRCQALFLSAVGIPIGFVLGYGAGRALIPVVIAAASVGEMAKVSASPFIFLFAGAFALVTVLFSCARPGRMAGRISPVEALRYTEGRVRRTFRAGSGRLSLPQMALANLGRSRTKMALVLLSLSLAVILFNGVYALTKGFDMEKYLNHTMKADFIVGTTEYFSTGVHSSQQGLGEEVADEVERNTGYSLAGSGYAYDGIGYTIQCYVTEQQWADLQFGPAEAAAERLQVQPRRGQLVETNLLLEGLDQALFEKLTVLEGDLTPLFTGEGHSIAVAVLTDDYGNPVGSYPEVGAKLPVTYVEEGAFYDRRTGELCDEDTPAEAMEWRALKSRDVEYEVCAIVDVPRCMGFRYSMEGLQAVLPREVLARDSGFELFRMFYLFDTPDEAAERRAEEYLADLTAGESSGLLYESRKTLREDFEGFRKMFVMIGGMLSFIVGLVGILNFFNGILTEILSRAREFAMLQAVGMTGRQLKRMLAYEGVFYALGAIAISSVLSVALEPAAGRVLEEMWWFFGFRFTLWPMALIIPAFLLCGGGLPLAVYHFAVRKSIVERLREY